MAGIYDTLCDNSKIHHIKGICNQFDHAYEHNKYAQINKNVKGYSLHL